MNVSREIVIMAALGFLIMGACAGNHERQVTKQENLGRGIVVGTVGVQQEEAATAGVTRMVAGEGLKIEGEIGRAHV